MKLEPLPKKFLIKLKNVGKKTCYRPILVVGLVEDQSNMAEEGSVAQQILCVECDSEIRWG